MRRAADDFATIRARMEELRQERERAAGSNNESGSETVPARAGKVAQPVVAFYRAAVRNRPAADPAPADQPSTDRERPRPRAAI